MENLKSKAILLFEVANDFTTKLIGSNPETNSKEWEVTYVPNLNKIYKEIVIVVKQLKDVDNFYKDARLKELIKIGEELRKRIFRLKDTYSTVKEISATNMGGATQTTGKGMQFTSKKAFKNPKEIKVKKLFNENQTQNVNSFQQERINAFNDIQTRINKLSPLVSNAKNSTIEFYKNNPSSFELHISTEIILNYLKKIEQLLNPNS
jgi:hypothetical protein